MEPTSVDRLLTVEQAAERLETTPRFPRRLIAERRIRFVRVGRFVRIPELTAEPARQRDEPPGNPMVRYRSSSCQADITFDADRFVTPCQDHRERAGRGS